MPSPRLRPSLNEEAARAKKEFEERRKARLLQVRRQESEIAATTRNRFQQRLSTEHEHLAAQLQAEWNDYQDSQSRILRERQELAFAQIGEAHRNAARPATIPYSKTVEGIQAAKQKAEARHVAAMAHHAEEEKRLAALQSQSTQKRMNAMAVEKRRSRQVSSRPLNVDNELADLLLTSKGVHSGSHQPPSQEPTYHHIDARVSPAMRPSCSAMADAEKVKNQREAMQLDIQRTALERQQAARSRHQHALQHERLRRDYEQQLQELESMRQSDNQRRKRQLKTVPKDIFVAPFIRMEQRQAEEEALERHVEAMCFTCPAPTRFVNHSTASASGAIAPNVPSSSVASPSAGSATELSISTLSSSVAELGDDGESPRQPVLVPGSGSGVGISAAPPLTSSTGQSQPLSRLLEHVRAQQRSQHGGIGLTAEPASSAAMTTTASYSDSLRAEAPRKGLNIAPVRQSFASGNLATASQPLATSVALTTISAPAVVSSGATVGFGQPPSHMMSRAESHAGQPVSTALPAVPPPEAPTTVTADDRLPQGLCVSCAAGTRAPLAVLSTSAQQSIVSLPASVNSGHQLAAGVDVKPQHMLPPSSDLSTLSSQDLPAGGSAYVVVTTPSILTVHRLTASSSSSSLASAGVPPSLLQQQHQQPAVSSKPLSHQQAISPPHSTLPMMPAEVGCLPPRLSPPQLRQEHAPSKMLSSNQAHAPAAPEQLHCASPQHLLPGWEETQAQLVQYRQSQQQLLEQFHTNMAQLQQQQVSLSQMMLDTASIQSSPGSQLSRSLSPSLHATPVSGRSSPGDSMSYLQATPSDAPTPIAAVSVSSAVPGRSAVFASLSGDGDVSGTTTGNDVNLHSVAGLSYCPHVASSSPSSSSTLELIESIRTKTALPVSSYTDMASSVEQPHASQGFPVSVSAASLYPSSQRLLTEVQDTHSGEERVAHELSSSLREATACTGSAAAEPQPGLSIIVEEPSVLSSSTSSLPSISDLSPVESPSPAKTTTHVHYPTNTNTYSSQPLAPIPMSVSTATEPLASDSSEASHVRPYETQLADLLERLRRVQSSTASSSSSETALPRTLAPLPGSLTQESHRMQTAASSFLPSTSKLQVASASSSGTEQLAGHLLSDLSTVSTSDLDLEVNNLSSSADSELTGKSPLLPRHAVGMTPASQPAASLSNNRPFLGNPSIPERHASPMASAVTSFPTSAPSVSRSSHLPEAPGCVVSGTAVTALNGQPMISGHELSQRLQSAESISSELSVTDLSSTDQLLRDTVGRSHPGPSGLANSIASSEEHSNDHLSYSSLTTSSSSSQEFRAKLLSTQLPAVVGNTVHVALSDDISVVQDYSNMAPAPGDTQPISTTSSSFPPRTLPVHAGESLQTSPLVDRSFGTPSGQDSPLRGYPPRDQPWNNKMTELVQSTPILETSSLSSSTATDSFLQAVAPLSPLKGTGLASVPSENHHPLGQSSGTLTTDHSSDLLPAEYPVSDVSSSIDSMADRSEDEVIPTTGKQQSYRSAVPSSKSHRATAFTVPLHDATSGALPSTASPSVSLQTSFKQRKQDFMKTSAERLQAIKQQPRSNVSKGRDQGKESLHQPVQRSTIANSHPAVSSALTFMTCHPSPIPGDRRVRFASPLQEFFSASFGSSSSHRSPVEQEEMKARTKRLVAGLAETRRRNEEEKRKEEVRASQQRAKQLQKKIDANRARKAAKDGQPRLHAHPLPPRKLQDRTVSSKPWRC